MPTQHSIRHTQPPSNQITGGGDDGSHSADGGSKPPHLVLQQQMECIFANWQKILILLLFISERKQTVKLCMDT